MTILITLRRIGPYHHARFVAAVNRGIDLIVIETRPDSQEYPWEFNANPIYKKISFSSTTSSEKDLPNKELDSLFNNLISTYNPSAVLSVGWSDRSYMRLLISCFYKRIPLIIASDSRHRDSKRSLLKESLKQRLLRAYQSALVAGIESREYLLNLGFSDEAIFQPWDVVDNNFFQNPLDLKDKKEHPHFLCVGRFLKRKNHITLLKAYSKYQEENGKLGLKLIGSGPLESNIKDIIRTLPNCSLASILPFQQLEELRVSYKQASAFILASTQDTWGLVINEAMASGLPCIASTACGCTQDLIKNNISGFSFDPMDSKKLTEIMHLIERQTSSERIAMKSASKQKLQNYTPDAFAIGLEKSINYAIKKNSFSKSAVVMAEFISRCLKFL